LTDKSRLKITRRQALAAVVFSGASIVGFQTTFGIFSDLEKSDENSIQASTLNLQLNGGESAVTILNRSGIEPGDSGSSNIDLSNSGDSTGHLDVTIEKTDDKEGTTSGSDSSGGELDSNMELEGDFAGNTVWSYETVESLAGSTYTIDSSFEPGASGTFTLSWQLPFDVALESKQDGTSIKLKFNITGR
jgi:hypothetical protein